MITAIITGAAGFIGFHTALRLLQDPNYFVVAIDNLNDYYEVHLKEARLKILLTYPNFIFYRADIADKNEMSRIFAKYQNASKIIHLAAQAGVRYSLENPYAYIESNINGYLILLELCRTLPNLENLIYASSSSVYGASCNLPFSIKERLSTPLSIYATTKISGELMSYNYSHLYQMPITILRFFTVYGPWGRPDMAMYLFAKAIAEKRPIRLFNKGKMRRDFTYIDDIVSGIVSSLNQNMKNNPYKIYNLGNNKSEKLEYFLSLLEKSMDQKAIIIEEEFQPGDMEETFADITESIIDLNFKPITTIEEGIPKFVKWFKDYTIT